MGVLSHFSLQLTVLTLVIYSSLCSLSGEQQRRLLLGPPARKQQDSGLSPAVNARSHCTLCKHTDHRVLLIGAAHTVVARSEGTRRDVDSRRK